MLPCAICNHPVPYVRSCAQIHADVCCWCFERNLRGSLDHQDHPAPRESGPVLSARDVEALVQYQAHVVRCVGAAALRTMITEDASEGGRTTG